MQCLKTFFYKFYNDNTLVNVFLFSIEHYYKFETKIERGKIASTLGVLFR